MDGVLDGVLEGVLFLSDVEVRRAVVHKEYIGFTKVRIDVAIQREQAFLGDLARYHIVRSSHVLRGLLVAADAVCLVEAASASFQVNEPFG